jgi:hypothetical protein
LSRGQYLQLKVELKFVIFQLLSRHAARISPRVV